jgi:hypothetical protein
LCDALAQVGPLSHLFDSSLCTAVEPSVSSPKGRFVVRGVTRVAEMTATRQPLLPHGGLLIKLVTSAKETPRANF